MIKRLNTDADFKIVQDLWPRIFKDKDAFGFPFHRPFRFALIFYPVDGYWLNERQFHAIMKAADAVGDDKFYMSVTERGSQFLEQDTQWLFENATFEEYDNTELLDALILENTLYSATAQWGIYISHENHAVASGTDEFMHELRKSYPTWRQDLAKLRAHWQKSPNAAWITSVLPHYEINPDTDETVATRE